MKHICVICGADGSKGGDFVPSTGGFVCIDCLEKGREVYSSKGKEK